MVDSHHDLLVSFCSIPSIKSEKQDKSKNITAPKLDHTRHKIVWTDEGIIEYNIITSKLLPDIRLRCQSSSSKALTSFLLQSTNFLMNYAASISNKMIPLTSTRTPKSEKVPKAIQKSTNALSKLNSKLKFLLSNPSSSTESIVTIRSRIKELRMHHRKLVRWTRLQKNVLRDKNLTSNTNELSKAVRKSNPTAAKNIKKLVVGEKEYVDENVPDGFFDSISSLKKLDLASLSTSSSFQSASDTYKNILKICESGTKVPEVSLLMADDILKSIRPSVNDFYSITASHYLNSGKAGLEHFANLLNVIISDLNNLSIEELNLVWACILYKGHEKDRTIDRSYRTISTCPFLSKAIDTYISILYSSKWNKFTAETQFQNKCSSHELAALTLSEAIIHSTKTLNRPAFALYLDARSAFDLALREFIVNNLYEYGIRDQGLLLIDQRLKNRRTVCEWDKQMMGPIEDECGVEQGGINSSDFYKVYNNEQLTLAQDSELGIPLGPVTVSAIGQADDVVLISNDLHSLQSLLDLSLYYCSKYNVSLSHDKTKLQVFSSRSSELEASIAKSTSILNIDGEFLSFDEEAEHVGVVRSVNGNLPHLLTRFAAYRKARFKILPVGIAKANRGNPASILNANSVYGFPVLFSGVATLALSNPEITIIDQHVKLTLQRLQKLRDKTPTCVVMFLGGQLPGEALLHLKIFSIFGMILRLENSFIFRIAMYQLTLGTPAVGSWFWRLKELCLVYNLPSPLSLLQSPPSKLVYKRLVKSKIVDHWEIILREEAEILKDKSLKYFRPEYMSLTKPHPLWLTCGTNPYEVHKAVIQAKMLSGRYVTDQLSRYWTPNKAGLCTIPGCTGQDFGSLEHLLLLCPALSDTRGRIVELWLRVASENSEILEIIHSMLNGQKVKTIMQFLLDCSCFPEVVSLRQTSGLQLVTHLFYLTRSWCYSIHRARMNKLGLYQYR